MANDPRRGTPAADRDEAQETEDGDTEYAGTVGQTGSSAGTEFSGELSGRTSSDEPHQGPLGGTETGDAFSDQPIGSRAAVTPVTGDTMYDESLGTAGNA